MCLVMQEQGEEVIVKKIGVEPTGLPFNSVTAVEELKTRLPLTLWLCCSDSIRQSDQSGECR